MIDKRKYIPAVGKNGVNNLKAGTYPPNVFGMNFFKRNKKGKWSHRL